MKIYVSIGVALVLGILIGVPIGYKIAIPKPVSVIKQTETFTIDKSPDVPDLNRDAINEFLAKDGISALFVSIKVEGKTIQGKVKSTWYDLPYEKRVDIASGFKRAWLAGREFTIDVGMQFTDHLGSDAFSYNAIGGLSVSR